MISPIALTENIDLLIDDLLREEVDEPTLIEQLRFNGVQIHVRNGCRSGQQEYAVRLVVQDDKEPYVSLRKLWHDGTHFVEQEEWCGFFVTKAPFDFLKELKSHTRFLQKHIAPMFEGRVMETSLDVRPSAYENVRAVSTGYSADVTFCVEPRMHGKCSAMDAFLNLPQDYSCAGQAGKRLYEVCGFTFGQVEYDKRNGSADEKRPCDLLRDGWQRAAEVLLTNLDQSRPDFMLAEGFPIAGGFQIRNANRRIFLSHGWDGPDVNDHLRKMRLEYVTPENSANPIAASRRYITLRNVEVEREV